MPVDCEFSNRLVPGRVRVAVRLRPRNAEEMMADADFADCVELQPEVIANVCFCCVSKFNFGNAGGLYLLKVLFLDFWCLLCTY